MKEFYFATMVLSTGVISKIEREISIECEGYVNRIISEDQLQVIVNDLWDIQKRMLSKNKRLAQLKICVLRDPDGTVHLRFGRSTLFFHTVKGSGKEAAASEKFNDGWWNCFDSFVDALSVAGSPEPLREVCTEILTAAGVTSSEAFMRAETLTCQTAKDVAEYYANLKFID